MKINALSSADFNQLDYYALLALQPNLKPSFDENSKVGLEEKFKLLKPEENKYFMLLFLDQSKKVPLLNLLTPEQLLWGITMFPKERLIKYLFQIEKKQLIQLYLKQVKLRRFLSFFTKRALLNVLRSKEVNKNQIMRGLMTIPVDELRSMAQLLDGQDYSTKQKPELLKILNRYQKPMLVRAMMALSKKSVLNLVTRIAEIMPEIMDRLPDYELYKMTANLPKPLLLQLMSGMEPEQHVDFLSMLGNKDLSYVLTAMDDGIFRSAMLTQFPDAIRAMSQKAA